MRWLSFPGEVGLGQRAAFPLGRTWTSLAHDEFDLDDSVEGTMSSGKTRKPFVVVIGARQQLSRVDGSPPRPPQGPGSEPEEL